MCPLQEEETLSPQDNKGRPELDKQHTLFDIRQRAELLKDIQRHTAKKTYLLMDPGDSSGFQLAWPRLRNWGVIRAPTGTVEGIETIPTYWIDPAT